MGPCPGPRSDARSALASSTRADGGSRCWPAAGEPVSVHRPAAGDRRSRGRHPPRSIAPRQHLAGRVCVPASRVHHALAWTCSRSWVSRSTCFSSASSSTPTSCVASSVRRSPSRSRASSCHSSWRGLLATVLDQDLAPAGVPLAHFVLFLGVAMSITAFPVLARILADTGLTRTDLGRLALTCAAVGDVTAWCLLAFVVGVVRSEQGSALLPSVMTLGYIALHVRGRAAGRRASGAGGSRRARHRSRRHCDRCSSRCWSRRSITEWIGIHAIFGAFLMGAVVPHDSRLARTRSRNGSRVSSRSCCCRHSSRSPGCGRRSA